MFQALKVKILGRHHLPKQYSINFFYYSFRDWDISLKKNMNSPFKKLITTYLQFQYKKKVVINFYKKSIKIWGIY